MRTKALSLHAAGLLAGLAATSLLAAPARAADPPAPAKADAAATPAAPAKAEAPKPPTKKQKDAARKAYAEGEKAYNSGAYTTAQAAFMRANEAIHSAQADYWIAKSIDQQSKTEEAIVAYQTFLDNPDAIKAGEPKVAEARTRIDTLKAMMVAEVAVETDPMLANVAVDGAAQPGEAPMTLKLTPGKHRITISSAGYQSKDIDVEVKGGDHQKQTIALLKEAPPVVAVVAAAPPPPPPPPAPPPEEHSKVPAYVTLGIAGVAGVVGTIFGVQALNSKSEFDKTPTTELADDTERSALIADMAFGVAITLGVTGVVLLTSDDEPPPATSRVKPLRRMARTRLEVAPYAGLKSGGASAKLTF